MRTNAGSGMLSLESSVESTTALRLGFSEGFSSLGRSQERRLLRVGERRRDAARGGKTPRAPSVVSEEFVGEVGDASAPLARPDD